MSEILNSNCEPEDVFERYINACEKHLPNQLYPHEPLLMNESRTEKAILEVKKMSYQIYEYKMKKHKQYARKNEMVKIHAYFPTFYKPMKVKITEINLNFLSKYKVEKHIKRIEKYSDKHPEKCYLKVLKKILKNNEFRENIFCFDR